MNRVWMDAGEKPKRATQIWRERRELQRTYKRDQRVRRYIREYYEAKRQCP